MLEDYPIIKSLNTRDIKTLTHIEIEQLVIEIRAFLIKELSAVGGHVGPNLGVVELTIALFLTFDSPNDQFFWDIGHQTYVHKILTGRAKQFSTLRQFDGLSGFIKRSESVHDIWEAGHASTSLSGGTGQTIERKLLQRNNHVISIIGDGALTGGMALEALNHIGDLSLPHIIVLNDNNMSITENVGAISRHINELRVNPSYLKAKSGTKYFLSKLNSPGKMLNDGIRWFKRKMRKLVLTNTSNTFFDNMGIDYYGPIDGHNIEHLVAAFEHAKTRKRPVVLHILTSKGKGFKPAELDANGSWHGIGPYSYESGQKVRKDERTLRQWSSVVSETLERFAQADERIVAVTPAMLKGSKLVHFNAKYPERTFDVGIAEEHAMTFSAGLALNQKLKPFIAIYSTFLQRAYDQLIHDVARQNLPVVIGVDRCGFASGDGETHHGIYDISLMNTIPNITVVMGKDAVETQQLLYSAFYKYDTLRQPIAIRYPRGYARLQYVSEFKEIPYATWEYYLKNDGAKQVILAFGPQLKVAEEVAAKLATDGYIVDVVNARFIKPLDEVFLQQIAENYTDVITIEEGSRSGGFGNAVQSYLQEQAYFTVRSHVFAINDIFIEQGANDILQKIAGIDAQSVYEKMKGRLK